MTLNAGVLRQNRFLAQAYKSTDWYESCLWLLMFLVGLAALIIVVISLRPYEKILGAWIFAIAIVPCLVFAGISVWYLNKRQNKEIGEIKESLATLGVPLITELNTAEKELFDPYINSLLPHFDLRHGVDNLLWLASNKQVMMFEHFYTVGSGKHTQYYTKVVIAFVRETEGLPAAYLADHPAMLAHKFRWLGRKWKKGHESMITVGDRAFDKQWEIYGSKETMERFFTKSARALLEQSPRGERWYVGGGWIACAYDQRLDDKNFMKFFNHVKAVASECLPA